MSENTNIFKAKVIKAGSVIKIEVSHGFYLRAQQLLFKHINDHPDQNFAQAIENLKTKPASTPYEYQLETLMSLLYEIENKAEEQGFVSEKEITQPTG